MDDKNACTKKRTNNHSFSSPLKLNDVGCQTDGDSLSKPLVSQAVKDWVETSPTGVVGSSMSPTASSSTAQKHSKATIAVNGSNKAMDRIKKAMDSMSPATPAGVKPNSVAEYFADKQNAAPCANSVTSTDTTKVRTSTTTGGELKKCARSNVNVQQQQSGSTAGSSTKSSEGPSWSDENSKLRLTIHRFSHLDETLCSEAKIIEGVSWKIMVMPKQHMVQKRQQKCMGFFLQCSPEKAYSDQWSVHAIADMRMLSYKSNVPHFARRTTHTYTSKENDWGYSCFMTWADILDESQGYINDDCVILEIAVKSEAPKNMMSHVEFLDKIQKWIVLADMQMKKGNVDLALEANDSAIKFCKGKDEKCLQKLDDQRKIFVNAKLVDSIQRIEKGKVPVTCSEPTHGKPTSLRQALSGAQKSLSGKMTAKGGKKTRAVVTVQHMKNKKKPYESATPNQQRVSNGNATVKDLVEIRKYTKAEEKSKDKENEHKQQKVFMNSNTAENESKETVDMNISSSSEESTDSEQTEEDDFEYDDDDVSYSDGPFRVPELEKKFTEPADDEEEDEDAAFNDLEFSESALNVMSCQPFGKKARAAMARAATLVGPDSDDYTWKKWNEGKGLSTADNELLYQGGNSKDITICDRCTQTENDMEGETSWQYADTIDLFNSDNELDSIIPPFKRVREDAGTVLVENGGDIHPNNFLLNGIPCYNVSCSKPGDKFQFGEGVIGQEYSPSLEFHSKWMDNIKTTDSSEAFTAENMASEFASLVLGKHLRGEGSEQDMSESGQSQINQIEEMELLQQSEEALFKYDSRLLKQYFNVEGAILHNLKADSVLGRMSEEDRKEVVDEVGSKISPLIVSLDLDFRDSYCSAQLFLEDSKCLYSEANKILDLITLIQNSFEEKIYPLIGEVNAVDKTSVYRFQKEKTVATSAAATSGAKPKHRHTIVARRTKPNVHNQKPSTQPIHLYDNNENEPKEPEEFELDIGSSNSFPEIQLNLRSMQEWMNNLISRLQATSKTVRQNVENLFGDEGAPKTLRFLNESRNNQMDKLNDDITNLKVQVEELKRENENHQMRASVLGGELLVEKDKHKNCTKEIKDVRTALKKAENRGTKEENRANFNQIQVNELEEKVKTLRKELDSVKKKSAEERSKTKKEKERDAQTIRGQSNELNSREKERDRALRDLEDYKKGKERADKENKQLNSHLCNAIERAKTAEASLLESKMSGSLDILNKRKTELLVGFNETQRNLNIVRQASDRDLLRKSLAEWKTALDKCDGHIKSISHEFECSIKNVRSGSSTLAQVGEIKVPLAEPLPKLMKPPPVQVVAPSTTPAPLPILATPAAGVIGQQRTTPVVSRNTTCSESPSASACSTPSKSRVSRVPSPTGTSNKSSDSTIWSWNTIGNIGEWGRNDTSFNSSLDQFHRDIWAVNGNNTSGGADFFRNISANTSSSQQPSSSAGPSTSQQHQQQASISTQPPHNGQAIPALGQLIRQHQQQQQQQIHSQVPSSQSIATPHLNTIPSRNTAPYLSNMSYNTDIWNTRAFQSQQQQFEQAVAQLSSLRLPSNLGQFHNGAGDQSNSSNVFGNLNMLNSLANPWRTSQQQPHSNSSGGLHNSSSTVPNSSSNGPQFPYFE